MKYIIFPTDAVIDFSKKLKVKFGIDPTSDRLHLGHLIPLLFVKKLWLEGHHIDIVLGNFTAQLGDPSGKDTMRPILTPEETEINANSIKDQINRIFISEFKEHPGKYWSLHKNKEWFEKMTAIEMVNILSKFTTAQLLSRDSFQKRIKENNSIGMHELVVPILQGFDSVHLKSNIEVGGTDQLFNFSISRDMQRIHGQEPEKCILMPIINGTDGRKMSKSFGNCIFINDTPKDVFGKTMSISDDLMKEWWPIFFEEIKIDLTKPMESKMFLAFEITKQIWSQSDAIIARSEFVSTIQKKGLPEDIQEIKVPIEGISILDIIVKVRNCSKNEAKRLIDSNGVKIIDSNGNATTFEITENTVSIVPGAIIKIGKRDFAKLV